jgi:hypothetical protein
MIGLTLFSALKNSKHSLMRHFHFVAFNCYTSTFRNRKVDFGGQNSGEQFGNAQSPQKCDRKQKRPWNGKVKSADILLFKNGLSIAFLR